jgi:hypothetical protein
MLGIANALPVSVGVLLKQLLYTLPSVMASVGRVGYPPIFADPDL